jgi:hypothetical protein
VSCPQGACCDLPWSRRRLACRSNVVYPRCSAGRGTTLQKSGDGFLNSRALVLSKERHLQWMRKDRCSFRGPASSQSLSFSFRISRPRILRLRTDRLCTGCPYAECLRAPWFVLVSVKVLLLVAHPKVHHNPHLHPFHFRKRPGRKARLQQISVRCRRS